MTLETQIHLNSDVLDDKLDRIMDDETMLEIHNLFAKTLDPYVPFLEGPLSQTVEVSSDCIRYIQPYAHRQYYGDEFNHTLDYHPLASARWDEACMATHMEDFEKQVQQILIRRAHDVYG